MSNARVTRTSAIPNVPKDVGKATEVFLTALKENAEVLAGRRGDTQDRAVTHREIAALIATALEEAGVGDTTELTTENVLAVLESAISEAQLTEELNEKISTLVEDSTNLVDVMSGNVEAFSELAGAADKVPYFTAAEAMDVTTLTSFARSLIDDTTAAEARTTLDAQQHDADLDAISALTGTGVATRQTDNSWLLDAVPVQNGFENNTDSTISFDDGTRTFTIAPVAANFVYWASGQKYTKTTPQTVTITDTEGLWYIYFVAGTLTASQTFSASIITEYAFTSSLYWDADNNTADLLTANERHGREMDSATHIYLHTTNGAQWRDGLAPNTVTADGSGNDDVSAQVGVDAGSIADEDIVHSFSAKTFPASIPFLYRSGAAGNWRGLASSGFVCTTTGSGRAAYNQNTGATWQLTEVSNGNFVLSHLYATNDTSEGLRWIIGQNEYSTLAQAQDGADAEITALNLGELTSFSAEFHPVASFIIQTSTAYSNTVKSRIRSTNSGAGYVDWRDPHTGGAAGAAGAGVPVGGAADEMLLKVDATDYNTYWATATQVRGALGLATTDTPVFNGLGIGGAPTTGYTVHVSKGITGATTVVSVVADGEVQAGVTSNARGFQTGISTQATAFALSQITHYYAVQGTVGAGSSVATQSGFVASSNLVGATSNYGFYGNLDTGAGRWNFYANGTADNYFGGPTTISVSSASDALRVTQAGAGNALVVEDSTNPDATPFVVTTDGRVISGNATAVSFSPGGINPAWQFHGYATVTGNVFNITNNSVSASHYPILALAKARTATPGSFAGATVQAADNLGAIYFYGVDAAATPVLRPGASIVATCESTPTTTEMPTYVAVSVTADGASSPTERLRIASNGLHTVTGDMTFSGTSRRISGDFSNATVASRAMLQSSTTNGTTLVEVIPNGTGVNAGWVASSSSSDPANCAAVSIQLNNGEARIDSFVRGSGTQAPLVFLINNAEKFRLSTGGNLLLGTTTDNGSSKLQVSGDVALIGSARRIVGDFSNATLTNRGMFKSSTTDGATVVEAIPNGASTTSSFACSSSSTDPDNCSFTNLLMVGGTEARIQSTKRGTGTYLPLTFYSGGAEAFRIDTSQNIVVADGNDIQVGSTTGTKIGTATTEKIGFWNATPVVKPTVTGSRGGNAALASLLTQLATIGLIVDSTSA